MSTEPGAAQYRNVHQQAIRAIAWALFLFVAYATLSAIETRPELVGAGYYKAIFTVIERFGAYAVLGALFYISYPRKFLMVCFLVCGSAAVLEIAQIFIPDRDARLIDALEKLAGGLVGIFAARAWAGPTKLEP